MTALTPQPPLFTPLLRPCEQGPHAGRGGAEQEIFPTLARSDGRGWHKALRVPGEGFFRLRPCRVTAFLLLLLLPTLAHAAPKTPALPPAPPPVYDQAPKPVSAGAYKDSAGSVHRWQVLPSHTLSWDGQPYLPVGVRFVPQSWKAGAAKADTDADTATLSSLKAHGIMDVTLAAPGSLLNVPAPAIQKTLDTLDANGFHYGLDIAAFPPDPLPGREIRPGAFRNPAPPTDSPARFGPIPGLTDAFYMLVSARDGTVDETGAAQIDGTTALVSPRHLSPDDVLILYPQRLLTPDTPEGRLPDVWQNYDAYRDSLLTLLRPLHFGPGLRFFLDPLSKGMAFAGETGSIIPTTDGWRLDFAAWLGTRYKHNVDDLNTGWGIAGRDLPSFTVASRSVPLWQGARGVPSVYDPVTGKQYPVLNKPRIGGHLWDDLAQFRVESVRGYLNAAAVALKKGVADVPVVYRWGERAPLWTQTDAKSGWDGLWVENSLAGRVPAQSSAVLALAQSEDGAKTEWLVTGGATVSDAAPPPTILAGWDGVRQVGGRGFFLSAVPVGAALDAMHGFGTGLQASASALASEHWRVLPFPDNVGLDITPQRLPSGVWWLPSARSGSSVALGPDLSGYYLPDPEGRLPTFVVWTSRAELRAAQFPLGKKALATVSDAGGTSLQVPTKGDVWNVPVGPEPVLLSRVSTLPLPLDAASALVAESPPPAGPGRRAKDGCAKQPRPAVLRGQYHS